MVWTAALTNFADGNTPTHTQINQYIDNLSWLHAPPTSSYIETSASDFTTAATTWAQISANFALSISVGGGATVLVQLAVSISNAELDIEYDGTRLGATPATTGTGIARWANALRSPTLITRPFFNLSAGSHTFTAVYKATSGTATIYAAYQPRFYVREL